MRTLASHHPHGSLSLALEYTWQHTRTKTHRVIFTALLKRMGAKIINCIMKQQQNNLMCGNIIHMSNSRYFWVKTNKNRKEWRMSLRYPFVPHTRISFCCISFLTQLDSLCFLNKPHLMVLFMFWNSSVRIVPPRPHHFHLSPCRTLLEEENAHPGMRSDARAAN